MIKLIIILSICYLITHRKKTSFGGGKKVYTTPAGTSYRLYKDLLKQTHILIAGASGSGKSVLVNGLIHEALFKFPTEEADGAGFILIDPKRVELSMYKNLPHTIRYASEPNEMVPAFRAALAVTEQRYKYMQANGLRKYPGGDIYVIIDELADLLTTQKKAISPLLQRLSQIGRAANVHIIAATQCPLSSVISTPIKVNFDAILGLRTRNAQDSRNIIDRVDGFPGCQTFPRYGNAYYRSPEGDKVVKVPMVPDADLHLSISHWLYQATPHGQREMRQRLANRQHQQRYAV